MAEELSWFTCPKCGTLGRIDLEQKENRVSIVCPECGWHGYARDARVESSSLKKAT